jgi:hypothetical protein
MRRPCYLLLSLALWLPAFGCAANNVEPAPTAADSPKTVLQVTNRNFYDMDVYVVTSGQRYRVGTASGNGSTSTFEFPSQWVNNGTVRILAKPIGKGGREFSEPIIVRPGDVVEVEIRP